MSEPVKLLINRLDPRAVIPSYQTAGAAAMDLTAVLDAPVTVAPQQRAMIPTGLAIALPDSGWVALLFGRSGLGVKYGVSPSNCVGVIDSDYRGEVKVSLTNFSDVPYTIHPGDRVAQLMITPVVRAAVEETDSLPPSERGTGGFGSTGK